MILAYFCISYLWHAVAIPTAVDVTRTCMQMYCIRDVHTYKHLVQSCRCDHRVISHRRGLSISLLATLVDLPAMTVGPLVLLASLVDLPATVGWRSWALAKNGTIALSGNCWDSGHQKMSYSFLNIIQYSIIHIYSSHMIEFTESRPCTPPIYSANFLHNDSCLSQGRKI